MTDQSLHLDVGALNQAAARYESGNEASFQLRSRLHAQTSAAIPSAMGGRAGQAAANATDQAHTDYQRHYTNNMQPLPDDFRQAGRVYGDADLQSNAVMNSSISSTINP